MRKRLILVLAVLLGGAVTALAVGFFLFRAEPTWYRPIALPGSVNTVVRSSAVAFRRMS